MIPKEIFDTIKAYHRIIIHRHERPDPDALGSQVGLAEILKASFPEKEIYVVGCDQADLMFLAKMDQIADKKYQQALVIVTDTANTPRVDDKRYLTADKIIKLDHHPNDEPYGDLMWVNTQASSCSEIIYDFYAQFSDELVLNEEAARLLYAGIVGDTGRFMYPATTAHTFEVVAKLRAFPFDATLLNRQLDEISAKVAKLMGYMLETIEIDNNGAAKVILPHTVLAEMGISDSETSSLVSFPGKIDSVTLWAIFVEQPEGFYRVRMRSKGPVINEIAKKHRGGGHPLASGASARDKAEVTAIYQELQDLVK